MFEVMALTSAVSGSPVARMWL